MLSRSEVTAQLAHTIDSIDCPALGEKIPGKVRDSYVLKSRTPVERVLITSDRLSAFDRILATIPFKGQLLNQMAAYWFKETEQIVPNHIIAMPHPNVIVARQVKILPIEMVIRGYLAGSAWRDYQAGRAVSGITLPQGMKKSQRFETPLITPSTKAEMGHHDEPISSEEVVARGIVEKKLWQQMSETALALFALGSKRANEHGLILVDTKYEFGILTDSTGKTTLVLADEVHTQDSSRYWKLASYNDRFTAGEDPEMLDKEFVRRWLIEKHNYMGDGEPPVFPDEFRVDIALKYIEAYELITGKIFTEKAGDKKAAILQALAGLHS